MDAGVVSVTLPLFFDWLASADGIGWVVAYAAALILTVAAHALVRATSEPARACLMLTFVAALPISLLGLGLALTALPRVLDQSGGFSTGDVIGFVVYGGVVLVYILGKALAQVVGALQAWQRHHAQPANASRALTRTG